MKDHVFISIDKMTTRANEVRAEGGRVISVCYAEGFWHLFYENNVSDAVITKVGEKGYPICSGCLTEIGQYYKYVNEGTAYYHNSPACLPQYLRKIHYPDF